MYLIRATSNCIKATIKASPNKKQKIENKSNRYNNNNDNNNNNNNKYNQWTPSTR